MLRKHYTQEKTKELLCINCSSAARDRLLHLDQFFSGKIENSDDSEGVKAHVGKAHGLIARFAALFHIWQYEDPTSCEIQIGNIEAAVSLFVVLQRHVHYAFAEDGLKAFYDAQRILNWLKREPKSIFKISDIKNGVGGMNSQVAFGPLQLLTKHNFVMPVKQLYPKEHLVYVVNPRILSWY